MSDVAERLAGFVDDWHAGRRPRVEDALAAAHDEGERSELAALLTAFLKTAPTPGYDDTTLDALLAEPAVAVAGEAFGRGVAPWPLLAARWRRRAGLSFAGLGAQVLEEAGIRGEGRERQAARYLEELERGERDAERVAPRLLDVLARVLGVPRAELGGTAAAGGALYRSGEGVPEGTGVRLEALADALGTSSAGEPEARRDPVDELFFG